MKLLSALVLLAMTSASVSYLRHFREVQGAAPGHQAYVIIDESVWQHAGPDLADLRLYAGNDEIPYALETERGSSETAQKEVRILQPGTVGGKTQFILDMAGMAEYDRIELKLQAKDFVANARIEGEDNVHGTHWTNLGHTILYDLSGDSLGSNSTIRLPLSTYKYLRTTIDGPLKPAYIQGASAAEKQEEKAVWRTVSAEAKQERNGKDTVFTFALPKNVPVERLEFAITSQNNFRRELEIQNEKKQTLGSGELSRIHMVRHGQKIDVEQNAIDLYRAGGDRETLKVIIHNGDDRPLAITGAHLQSYERRVYFTPSAGSLRLYYDDEKLDAPVYDYAKLFQKEAKAVQASLSSEQVNSAYKERPDERPWSERHPIVLWIAIIGAVVILGALALRSMLAAAA